MAVTVLNGAAGKEPHQHKRLGNLSAVKQEKLLAKLLFQLSEFIYCVRGKDIPLVNY